MSKLLPVVAVVFMFAGCSDAHFRDRAVKTAASEHRCPRRQVTVRDVVAEDRMHSEFAYWLDVCGKERLYRLDATTGDRFVDQTTSTR
jgi:hypothetical protein